MKHFFFLMLPRTYDCIESFWYEKLLGGVGDLDSIIEGY